MTTAVTKESLAARIAELESGARSLKEDYTLAAYKMLLATMEAEPVAWTSNGSLVEVACGGTAMLGTHGVVGDVPLYCHAQPAPVVPDFKKLARELVDNLVDCGGLDEGVKEKYLEWAEKTCRATMLNGGKP